MQGESHLLASNAKSGKTTLLLHLVREWQERYAEGAPTVLWFSEEGEHVWGRRKAHYAHWDWLPVIVVYALGEQPRDMIMRACDGWEDVVIVDTCTTLMRIDDQNNPSQVAAALRSWISPILKANKTLIFVHHRNKSGGEFGTSVAGSYMWTGSVDSVLEIREDAEHPNRRVVIPRCRVEVPSRLVYELSRGRLVPLGQADEVQLYGAGQVPPWDAATRGVHSRAGSDS